MNTAERLDEWELIEQAAYLLSPPTTPKDDVAIEPHHLGAFARQCS